MIGRSGPFKSKGCVVHNTLGRDCRKSDMQPDDGGKHDYSVYSAIDDWAHRTKKGAADTGSACSARRILMPQAGSTTTFVLTGV